MKFSPSLADAAIVIYLTFQATVSCWRLPSGAETSKLQLRYHRRPLALHLLHSKNALLSLKMFVNGGEHDDRYDLPPSNSIHLAVKGIQGLQWRSPICNQIQTRSWVCPFSYG